MTTQASSKDDRSDDMSTVTLIRLAGRRPEPAAFRVTRVRLSVEKEWRRVLRRRRMRRSLLVFGVAACVALAVAIGVRTPAPTVTSPVVAPIASVARVVGPVQLELPERPTRALVEHFEVPPGAIINTSTGGGVALQFRNGGSVRIDANSRVVITSASRLALEQGRLYVDRTAVETVPHTIEIATRSGLVREIGTQFEVAVVASVLQIRVREGIVHFDGPDISARLAGAESLRIEADGRQRRGRIATHGLDWSWIEELAPPFRIEGATLASFLDWVCRERGLRWRFDHPAAARTGRAAVLHGSIEGLTPAAALDAILPATGLAYRRDRGELVIGLAR